MIHEKACLPFVLLAVLIALDCYVDDLTGAFGIQSELIFEPPSGIIAAFLVVWIVLLAATSLALYLAYRRLRPAGWIRVGYVILSAYALGVAAGNIVMRMALLAKDGVVSQLTTPPVFFVETYATRLSVYVAISVTGALLLLAAARGSLRRRPALASLLLLAAVIAAASSLFAGGIQTLISSPYWEGASIVHGKLYMGTFPRQYAALVEPWATGAFLVGFLLFVIELLKLRRDSAILCPPLLVAVAIFVQVLPGIGRGLITEALYGADFYYAFRLDRSMAFPLLPLLILSLAILSLRISRGKAQGPGSDIGNT